MVVLPSETCTEDFTRSTPTVVPVGQNLYGKVASASEDGRRAVTNGEKMQLFTKEVRSRISMVRPQC